MAGPLVAGALTAAAFCPAQTLAAGVAGGAITDTVASTVASVKSAAAMTTKAVVSTATTTVASTTSNVAGAATSTVERLAPAAPAAPPPLGTGTPAPPAPSIAPSLPVPSAPPASVAPRSAPAVAGKAPSPLASRPSPSASPTSGNAAGASAAHTVAPTASYEAVGPAADGSTSTRVARNADAGYGRRGGAWRSAHSSGAAATPAQTPAPVKLASQMRAPSAAQRQAMAGGGGELWRATTPPGYSASATGGSGGPGLAITPASHTDSQLLVLIAALLATLAIGALSLDAVGIGPRNRRWRTRWLIQPGRALTRRKRGG